MWTASQQKDQYRYQRDGRAKLSNICRQANWFPGKIRVAKQCICPGSAELKQLRGKRGVQNAGGARTAAVDDPTHALRWRTIRLKRIES